MNTLLRLKQWTVAPFAYSFLFRSFLQQDISGRFAGSMGGLFWSVVTPLTHILIYVFVFSMIMKVSILARETGTDRFVVYLLSGLLPWMAFSEALIRSASFLTEKSSLITKVSFPVEILPYVNTVTPFMLNGIGFGLFLIYLIFLGYLHPLWLVLPLAVLAHLLFTIGLVALISALSVFIRDLQHLLGLVVSAWLFLTPILYPLSMVPETYQRWMVFNPAYPFIELYHQILLQHQLPLELVVSALLLACGSFFGGGWFFARIKHAFGDVL